MTADVDILIVGAGAAGVGAARRASELGLSFRLIEAKDRIGGRAFTDTETFGMPWDRGAHWLHSADLNPLTKLADQLGHAYVKREPAFRGRMCLGHRWASMDERREFQSWFDDTYDEMTDAGDAGKDIPASTFLDPSSRWYRLGWHIHEAISAAPPDRISTLDLSRYKDTYQNWPLERGYGALIEAAAEGIPVALNAPVTHIDVRGNNVVAMTVKGDISTKACIVTSSTNVLASGRIRFTPSLPDDLQTALDNVPTGGANKVALQFSHDVFGPSETRYESFMDERDPKRHAISFQISPFGHNLAASYMGGSFAAEMEKAGEDAMIEFTRAALSDMFGSDILKSVIKTATTGWCGDPYIMGAYSCAKPGHADARRLFLRPIAERIFLAGEATSPDWFSTVHGAFISGGAAVERAAAIIASSR